MKEQKFYPVLYTFSYMALGSLTPMIGQYLDHIGFDGTQIGLITGTATGVAVFAVGFWGRIYYAVEHKARVIAGLCTGAMVMAVLFSDAKVFAVVLVLYGCMYFVQAPVCSLLDAFAVNRLEKTGNSFGGMRAWGAVGFALGVLVAAWIAGRMGVSSIFKIYTLSYGITALALLGLQRRSGGNDSQTTGREIRRKGGYATLLKERKLIMLMIAIFFLGGTNVANNTFFSFLYIEGGGNIAGVGVAMLLMVGSEVPFMAWSSKLAEKFTLQKTILYAMIISVARFALYGVGLPWWALIALFFTQGAVNGIILVEFVRYVAALAPKGYESLAISAYYLIDSNISTIVCQTVGGRILDIWGAGGVYMFFALFNLMGLILYVLFGLQRPIEQK